MIPYLPKKTLVNFGKFEIFGKTYSIRIATYAFTSMLAFLSVLYIAVRKLQKQKEDVRNFIYFFITVFAFGMIFARLYFVLFVAQPRNLGSFARLVFTIGGSGIRSGGLIVGMIIGAYVFYRFRKVNIWRYLDAICIGLGLGIFIARFGCYNAGCCYGKETGSVLAIYLKGDFRHPTQLYSMINGLVLYVATYFVDRYKKFDGFVALVFAMMYSATRFTIEFLRHYNNYYLGLTSTQILLVAVFFCSLGIIFYRTRKLREGEWEKDKKREKTAGKKKTRRMPR